MIAYSVYSTVMQPQRDEQSKPCLMKLFTQQPSPQAQQQAQAAQHDRQCPLLFLDLNEAIAEHGDLVRVHDDSKFNREEVNEVVSTASYSDSFVLSLDKWSGCTCTVDAVFVLFV